MLSSVILSLILSTSQQADVTDNNVVANEIHQVSRKNGLRVNDDRVSRKGGIRVSRKGGIRVDESRAGRKGGIRVDYTDVAL